MREKRENDGTQVRMYLASVNLPPQNPWCYALQYWAFTQVPWPVPILRTGLCAAAWNRAVQSGSLTAYIPHVGDLVFWKYATSVKGHVERIIHIGNAGWVVTIGGNTSPPTLTELGRLQQMLSGVPVRTLLRHHGLTYVKLSQRNGDGVYVRLRNLRHPLARMTLRGLLGRKAR